jgi:glycosyltransferase involved in cell wall biosynthesis
MNILIAIGAHRQEEAGASGVVLNHARELEKSGHNVECWFLEDILRGPVRPRRLEPIFFAAAIAKRILKERKRFDVVNLHAPCGCVYGVWRWLFRPKNSPPYVMTLQGSEERYVQAMRIENRKGRAWHFALKNRIWHRAFHQPMYDYSIKSADYGAVANREGWIMAELKHGREFGRIRFVPNGADERFFTPRQYQESGPLRLLYVGTWLDRKGVYYLADAFALVAKATADLRLTVAGCGASEAEVKKYFEPELRDQICVVPFVKRDDMLAVYQQHDIFVFPSLVEGMPLTLLEAMATGMPVVTTNTSGMADVVEDKIDGLLVPAADAETLKMAIERLSGSVALRRQLGLAAQEKMRRYTWKRVTEELEGVLTLAARSGRFS